MIEKLREQDLHLGYIEPEEVLLKKINELVDAVNNQQIQLNNHECRLLDLHNRITALDDPTYHEEPADPYAEQRKWIGKLCRFWDDDPNDYYFDTLNRITLDGCYVKENGYIYENCEPVKPDDDIIYKGGDNE